MDGFLGEQFALPVAVESLRAMRNAVPETYAVSLSAVDPLNLVGIIVPGDRVPAPSKRQITFRNGVAVAESEAEGEAQAMAYKYASTSDLVSRATGGAI